MFQNILINNRTIGYLKFALANESCYVILQVAVTEYDDFQIAVLINWVENKKQRYYGKLVVKLI